jgi:hypothetical protein
VRSAATTSRFRLRIITRDGEDGGEASPVPDLRRERATGRALDVARERGLSTFKSAKSAADLRFALRAYADQIAEQYPDFGEMFDRLLNREMVADEEATAA